MHEICVSDNIQSAIAMIEFPILEEIFIELPVLEVVFNKVELRKLMNGVVSRIFSALWGTVKIICNVVSRLYEGRRRHQ